MSYPIIITGAARSGTSMVAGIIDRCGAWGGDVLGPTPANKRGQYENRAIVDQVVKPYLHLQGLDPMCQRPLPDVNCLLPFDNLRQRVEGVLRAQGWDGDQAWYYKCAKACLMWPVWHKAFPNARWVVVRRKDEQIIASCLRTGFMRAYRDAAGWQKWVDVHKARFYEMVSLESGLDVCEIWPERFFVGDFLEAKSMIDWLGLEWDGNAVLDFVSPALWNGGK